MNAMALSNRVSLVTGAGSNGIGRAIVLALAEAGSNVAIHHFNQLTAAEELAALVEKMNRKTVLLEADLSDPESARSMVRSCHRHFGTLDIVANCAATLERRAFLEITDAEWDHVHAVNLHGYFCVSQEAARIMVAAKTGGRIIMVSSVNQEHATANLAHYVASKGGVKMLARAMALELAPHAITVNLIAPGSVLTDINRQAFMDDDFRRSKQNMIPINRVASPGDIAGAAVYLASEAASYVTGATITVDGGLTL
jgi:NAD(P)-dependent dehydrogenase (short-subunit alcohol dehydrogenase family)